MKWAGSFSARVMAHIKFRMINGGLTAMDFDAAATMLLSCVANVTVWKTRVVAAQKFTNL